MSDLESIKRVLMATKEKAKGMRKAKMSARVNPKPPVVPPAEMTGEESGEAPESDAVKMAEGAEDDESKEDPESLKEAIRELLARV